MKHMASIYLSLGSNQGDLLYNLQRAKEVLQHRQWVVLETCSPVYVSEPWGKLNQPWFLNQVCRARTDLSPRALIRFFRAIEYDMGRRHDEEERWGPRTIDIDLLDYDGRVEKDHIVEGEIPAPSNADGAFVFFTVADVRDADVPVPTGWSEHECPRSLRLERHSPLPSPRPRASLLGGKMKRPCDRVQLAPFW